MTILPPTIMNAPNVEQATLEDLPRLTDLLVGLFERQPDFTPNRLKQMRGLRLILENPARGRIFVLREHGKILGMVNLLFTISTAEGGLVMILEDLVIDPKNRGHGYGSILLEHALRYAKEKDFARITLLSDRSELESQKFFRQYDFVESNMLVMRRVLSKDAGEEPPSIGA